MGRIFVSAGHDIRDPGAVVRGTTEAKEMMLTRDKLVSLLQSRGEEVLSVPDSLDLRGTIRWINERAIRGDIALDLHGNAANGSVRGTECFFIDGNNERKKQAEQFLDDLLEAVPELHISGKPRSRGAKSDTLSQHRRLAFCRDISVSSLLIELCFLDNPSDLALLQNHRERFVLGLANGLVNWSKSVHPRSGDLSTNTQPQIPVTTFPVIDIKINDQLYEDKGILVNNNSFIPVDLVDRLGIQLPPTVRRTSQGNVVYVKAIDLQEFNISIAWDSEARTVSLNTISRNRLGQINRIMSSGHASEHQLISFLKDNNEDALSEFPNLPKFYIEEAALEGINHDVAFCQMCLETGFLRFGGDVEPQQNNFCGLGAIGGGVKGASFPDIRTGIKAHIQHLKAYASTEPIAKMPSVSPRFHLVQRGIAPLVNDLSGRWAIESQYGAKIMAIVHRFYTATGIL